MALKLSIITVCYNEKQIERTCQSILAQKWQDFEWIVVDGGSTDGTLDILEKFKNRINVLVSEPDQGIYNAMNKGIKLAKGEYLNFMNGGDCFYDENVLDNVFNRDSPVDDILYGKCVCSDGKRYSLCDYPAKMTLSYLRFFTINHQSSFIKKDLFNRFGLYNENYKIASDYEKFLVFVQNKCRFTYLNFPIALYDLTGFSIKNEAAAYQEKEKIRSLLIHHKTSYKIALLNLG